MKDSELEGLVFDWLNWCHTRRFYAPAPQHNILAQFLPRKFGKLPNARNNAQLQYFNMAVNSMANMDEHRADYQAFHLHYLSEQTVVKRKAAQLGIAPRTYYDRVRRFTRKAWQLSEGLQRNAEQEHRQFQFTSLCAGFSAQNSV